MPNKAAHPQLWLARVGDATDAYESKIRALLSPTELQRLQATRSIHKQREYLLSRALMRHALSHTFMLPEQAWFFTEQPGHLPHISNLPGRTHLSLSHSHGLIGFIIANSPVGIDLEAKRQTRNFAALAETFMDSTEIERLKHSPGSEADYFYRTWCAKEAYYKAIPPEQQAHTSLNSIIVADLCRDTSPWTLFEETLEQTQLTIVLQQPTTPIDCHTFPARLDTPSMQISAYRDKRSALKAPGQKTTVRKQQLENNS